MKNEYINWLNDLIEQFSIIKKALQFGITYINEKGKKEKYYDLTIIYDTTSENIEINLMDNLTNRLFFYREYNKNWFINKK